MYKENNLDHKEFYALGSETKKNLLKKSCLKGKNREYTNVTAGIPYQALIVCVCVCVCVCILTGFRNVSNKRYS